MASKISRLADLKIILDRGMVLFNWIRNAALIGASLKVVLNLSVLEAVLLTLISLAGFFIAGYIDTRKLKLMQAEARLLCTKYNSQLNKIGKTKKEKV